MDCCSAVERKEGKTQLFTLSFPPSRQRLLWGAVRRIFSSSDAYFVILLILYSCISVCINVALAVRHLTMRWLRQEISPLSPQSVTQTQTQHIPCCVSCKCVFYCNKSNFCSSRILTEMHNLSKTTYLKEHSVDSEILRANCATEAQQREAWRPSCRRGCCQSACQLLKRWDDLLTLAFVCGAAGLLHGVLCHHGNSGSAAYLPYRHNVRGIFFYISLIYKEQILVYRVVQGMILNKDIVSRENFIGFVEERMNYIHFLKNQLCFMRYINWLQSTVQAIQQYINNCEGKCVF